MIAGVALLALAVAAPDTGLREGRAAYRVELGGVPVGRADLSLRCDGGAGACRLTWSSRLRLPAASGGALRARRFEAELDAEGRARTIEVEVDGARRTLHLVAPAAPASAAELLLAARGGGCVPVVDEESGSLGQACVAATPDGAGAAPRELQATVLGATEVVTMGDDGLPSAVELPAQRTRFVRDSSAAVPDEPPAFEVRVPGPPDGRAARTFCGVPVDPPARPPPPAALSRLPPPRPDGRSCRDQAAAYAERARRAGFPARIALGVAHDGQGFVWHAWAEVRTPAGWLAVDPAFGQLPARGPRFTLARHAGAPAEREAAGSRILACWGRASVE